jgi:hypothetical protein
VITTQADLEAALAVGGLIEVDPGVLIHLTGALPVTVPCRIVGGHLAADAGPVFDIATSGVELDHVRVDGGGQNDGYDPTQKLVYAHGSSGLPLSGITVHHCDFSGSRADNVWMEWCTDSTVHDNTISHYLYSGVMVLSGNRVQVDRNNITDAPLSPGVVNVYGIAFSDLENTVAARSRNCSAAGNLVSQVDWEGIDTHGGDSISVTDNTILGCPTGIALVSGNPTRVVAPTNCVASGNIVNSAGARRPVRQGVVLYGIPGVSASATVTANQVTGYDTPFLTNYWARGDTYIGGNSRFVDWTPIDMGGDYNPNTTYPPEFMVDGNTVWLRGGVIPKAGGVAARDDIGSIPNPAGWPTKLTFVSLTKGSGSSQGMGMIAVYPNGQVKMSYGIGTDSFTYFFSGPYQAA